MMFSLFIANFAMSDPYLFCQFSSTKIGKTSDMAKCLANFDPQTHGFLKLLYCVIMEIKK